VTRTITPGVRKVAAASGMTGGMFVICPYAQYFFAEAVPLV
jgi:hypothetical protein